MTGSKSQASGAQNPQGGPQASGVAPPGYAAAMAAGWPQWGLQAAAQQQQQDGMEEEQLRKFWADMKTEAEAHSENPADFKAQQLPLARIKKIMKSDEDVRMISAEAPVLFAKACEYFVLELTTRAWAAATETRRRTLQRSDVATAISCTDVFDFLVDIVPREEANDATGGSAGPGGVVGPSGDGPQQQQAAQQQQQQHQQQPMAPMGMPSHFMAPPGMEPPGTSSGMQHMGPPPPGMSLPGMPPGMIFNPYAMPFPPGMMPPGVPPMQGMPPHLQQQHAQQATQQQ